MDYPHLMDLQINMSQLGPGKLGAACFGATRETESENKPLQQQQKATSRTGFAAICVRVCVSRQKNLPR